MVLLKAKRGFWEKIFDYPSFNTRFFSILIIILALLVLIWYILLYRIDTFKDNSDRIAVVNTIIQFGTLVLGTFAAYYALRQLVETRYISLRQAGYQNIKSKKYDKAFKDMREGFYIKPEADDFNGMLEAILLSEDYETFDQYIKLTQKNGLFIRKIFKETTDQIIILYLHAVRHLMVKNQGESEKYLAKLVALSRTNQNTKLNWDFSDFMKSTAYVNLSGECKTMTENLIAYLTLRLTPDLKEKFEFGDYSCKPEAVSNTSTQT